MRTLAALLIAILAIAARAAEPAGGARPSTLDPRPSTPAPWLKKDDVVALVGGEDMVALAEEGWLETLVTWAQPKDRIRWRSLAWEGDTVFEQRRDLNYPALETQLDKMGATVVICQFGKMESFAGKEGVAAFTEAYEKLLARLNPEGKRRIALVIPTRFYPTPARLEATYILPNLSLRNADLAAYCKSIRALAAARAALVLESEDSNEESNPVAQLRYSTRDGIHFHPQHHYRRDSFLANRMGVSDARDQFLELTNSHIEEAIQAKNRAWFHYTRPQNWAFLAGNRTNQPSSRDHKDPTKRWFPEEMEQWVPLIEAKEREIWKLAEAPR